MSVPPGYGINGYVIEFDSAPPPNTLSYEFQPWDIKWLALYER